MNATDVSKPAEAQEPSKQELLEALMVKFGDKVAIALIGLANEIEAEARQDVETFRIVRSAFLEGGEKGTAAVFGLLSKWQPDPTSVAYRGFIENARELLVFGVAEKLAAMPDMPQELGAAITMAVQLLRRALSTAMISNDISDMN